MRWNGIRSAACAAALLGIYGTVGAFDPANGDFARQSSTNIRVMAWNVEKKFRPGGTAAEVDAIGRVLDAVQPDVIVMEEVVPSDSAANLKTLFETKLGGTWTVYASTLNDGFNKNLIATRYSLSMQIANVPVAASPDYRGVTGALVDLPDATYGTTDLYIMGLHLKSGGNLTDEESRQRESDAIINWIRDLQTAGGTSTLAHSTPIVYVGDFNVDDGGDGDTFGLIPSTTLVTGDIVNEGTFGSDWPPDWDGSANTDSVPYDHTNGESMSHPATTAPDSRYDRIYFTDSVMQAVGRFIVNTNTMSGGALAAAGLQSGDTDANGDAPDHLPLIVDFALGEDLNQPGQVVINEFSYDDAGGDDRTFVELKNIGGQPVNLDAPIDYVLVRGTGLPTSAPGSSNVAATYDLQGVIPAGGVFVLYDDGDQSAGIQATIEAALPAVQRQKDSNFILANTANSGIALLKRSHVDGATADTLVEALLHNYDSSSSNYFLRTSATTNLTITFSGGQLGGDLDNSDNTISRRVDDRTLNNYADWVIGDTATPGTTNNTTSSGPDPAPSAGIAIAAGEVVINEIDYDDPGSDDESYVEILNKSGRTIDVSELEIVASESGAYKRSYRPGFGSLSDGARWVFATTTDSGSVSGSTNEPMSFGDSGLSGTTVGFLENGPDDGVYLRLLSSPSTIIDSVSYGGSGAHVSGSPDTGAAGTDSDTLANRALSRKPDGTDTNDNAADFGWVISTPGAQNSLVPVELDSFSVR